MNSLHKYYSTEDNLLVEKITGLINERKFENAIKQIRNRLKSLNECNSKEEYLIKVKLAGLLNDIGEEGKLKQASLDGISIIEKEKENIKGIITEGSIEYNLGNAKSTLFKLQREEPNFKYRPQNISYLLESKNHYWKSYKIDLDQRGIFNPQLVVNLANTLSSCGRITESLQYYDLVIEKFPDHPQANASRSEELIWLKNLSGCFTQNLIFQAKAGYEKASKCNNVPKWLVDIWREKAIELKESLEELGFDRNRIHKDLEEMQKENETLSNYRRYCIDNHLTLSEHSLYCKCIGARRDDLLICTPHQSFKADFIPIMEKILNRLKSEYSLARLMYYYSTEEIENEFNAFDSEVMFTELYDSEYIGTKSEMLRTSFRLCFGILDKIANAICLLFDLADKNEKIYFESFWKPNLKNASLKQDERWEKINNIDNISLVALYTQATDLNSESGEWHFFKAWRNALEHIQFILLSNEELGSDIFNICENIPNLLEVDKEYFTSKTLQMLQFTRSAIFNYAFLVRLEARKINPKEGKALKHTLHFKTEYTDDMF